MARTDNTKVMWRVQYRKGRGLKWHNRTGLFERREDARHVAKIMREGYFSRLMDEDLFGYGFGNTRVIRHIRGEKK